MELAREEFAAIFGPAAGIRDCSAVGKMSWGAAAGPLLAGPCARNTASPSAGRASGRSTAAAGSNGAAPCAAAVASSGAGAGGPRASKGGSIIDALPRAVPELLTTV